MTLTCLPAFFCLLSAVYSQKMASIQGRMGPPKSGQPTQHPLWVRHLARSRCALLEHELALVLLPPELLLVVARVDLGSPAEQAGLAIGKSAPTRKNI